MLIIIFLKIIRILYLLFMFVFCFCDQVFVKMLEMLLLFFVVKLLEFNFEEVFRRGVRIMLFEIWIYKCVLGICSMMLCLGFGVIGNFVNLYEKKR